nr:hypothetical protein [Tanacetum cinerariifolium]
MILIMICPSFINIEGHSLHFGRPEFALITGLPFGTVNFGLYTFGELKFRNRVFPYKLGFSVTNLDIIGVIEDEETFRKLCDQESIRLCLILTLEVIFMGRLLTCPADDILFRDEHYFEIKKDRMYVPTYTSSGFVFAFQVMFGSLIHLKDVIVGGLKIQKLYQEHLVGRKNLSLKDLIGVTFLQRFLHVKETKNMEQLRLCLEDEERMLLEQKKNIIEEQRFRVEEAKRMRLEEDKLLQIAELK